VLPDDACTTVIACDQAHLGEFAVAMPTWRKFHPELWRRPMVAFCDDVEPPRWWERQFRKFAPHDNCRFVAVPPCPGASQRGRMLATFIFGVAEHVSTRWYLKMDSDLACMGPCPDWEPDDWFDDAKGHVFIAHPWGYTKSIKMFTDLVAWAATVPALAGRPEPPGHPKESKDHYKHRRIISFLLYGRTEFVREVAALAPALPCPSQDTFLWYMAAKLGRPYCTPNMGKRGWAHNARRLHVRCRAAMEQELPVS